MLLLPIAQVAQVIMGQSPPGSACNRTGNGVPLLNGPTEFGDPSPIPAQWTTAPTRLAERGDLLFCVRGSTTGRTNVADQRYCVGRGIAALRGVDSIDTKFLRYTVLRMLPRLLALTSGSVFPNLSGDDIRGFAIPWPERSLRESVVRVVSLFEERIRSNVRAAATISAMAPLLFTKLCPSTGQTILLGDIATFRKGVSYRRADLQASDTAMVTLKSFDRAGGYRPEGLKPFVGEFKPEQEIFPGELAVAQTDLTQAADVVGRVIRVPTIPSFKRLVASLDVAIVRPLASVPNEYLYAVLLSDRFREHCRSWTSGTTVLHLASDALPDYLVPAVDTADQVAFADVVRPYLQERDVLDVESQILGEVRDLLLSELISENSNLAAMKKLVRVT
jgi:type I restriction enzyme S subunit